MRTQALMKSGDERVGEWESGLPSLEELTPLSQTLISPELASAFRIAAARKTIEENEGESGTLLPENLTENNAGDEQAEPARTLKKPRLVWSPQLHKRFADAVAQLGIKHAVPKTIMQLMNVDGLTRENIASHLQKYRLYLKRMQGLSKEGPSVSDPLFASTPLPPTLAASAHLLHRDDPVPPFAFPAPSFSVPIAELSREFTPSRLNASRSHPGFDSPTYRTPSRSLPAQLVPADHRDNIGDNHNQTSSPTQILALFPSAN